MVEVSRDKFFATVGQLDVNPYPTGNWSDEIGYVTLWKLRSGRIVGKSWGRETVVYMVDESLVKG